MDKNNNQNNEINLNNINKLLEEISKLKEENQQLKNRKKFGLVWEDKFDEKQNIYPLIENKNNKEKDFISDNLKPMNYLIEGDNLETLKTLNYTHKNKIDVIYIDPPYNTGNKDFKYNDSFVDKEDGYRHSKWLSFMNKRLLLAKELLTNEGVIFISIDDNEQARLKLLCDEIFGENKNLVNFCWIATKGEVDEDKEITLLGSNIGNIKHGYEYILCYTKNNGKIKGFQEEKELFSRITNAGNSNSILKIPSGIRYIGKEKNKIFSSEILLGGTSEQVKILTKEGMIIENGVLKNDIEIEGEFRNPNIVKQLVNRIQPFDNKGQQFIELVITNSGVFNTIKKQTNSIINNVLSGYGDTSSSKSFLNNIGINFSYAKPMDLIKDLINFIPNKDAIILDFFAGSGTTGHAIQQLNKEDGGNRQYILCTNNENKICEDITYERLARINNPEKYNLDTKKVSPLPHNLTYLKIKEENKEQVLNIKTKDGMFGIFEYLTFAMKEIVELKEMNISNKINNNLYSINAKYIVILENMEEYKKIIETNINLKNKDVYIISTDGEYWENQLQCNSLSLPEQYINELKKAKY
jgi:adenine-specific DNA-methyltransferase